MAERLMVKCLLDSDSPKVRILKVHCSLYFCKFQSGLIAALVLPNGFKLFLFRNYSILMSLHTHYD